MFWLYILSNSHDVVWKLLDELISLQELQHSQKCVVKNHERDRHHGRRFLPLEIHQIGLLHHEGHPSRQEADQRLSPAVLLL